ncbi:platelet-activating factor acetylhydrolase, isoform II-domain-containing protein [Lineolata rhizophorae]|uniref:1-alkyl-2-acetylglycerophosphocholine esterase n=1 Tax=Lineolata rhizophorae TaxID=578093 RepID=A0A6A6P7R2_9PEZI|nr:platelet-activating factor acetylhydrolase, isoform II-domain-containing protein [Lineolata rhizophorae]
MSDLPFRSRSGLGELGSRSVPRSKKPKARPPRSKRDRLGFFHGKLPTYSGPYPVGVMTIEVPAESPRTFSHIKRDGQHLLKLETVLFTLYYPCLQEQGTNRAVDKDKPPRETWLPRPRTKVAEGYGKFASIGKMGIPLFTTTTMLTKLPAVTNAPPSRKWPPPPPPANPADAKSKPKYEDSDKEPVFNLLIFSHGLGGTRTAYSSLCGEFASYGFVVCAVEHRDGSGPRTYVNFTKDGQGSLEERELDGRVDHNEQERTKKHHRIDYVFPKNNPLDTSPNNDKGVDKDLRLSQIALRMAEVEEAYRVLRCICKGDGEEIAAKNLRGQGFVGGCSHGLEGVNWNDWKDKFYLDGVTMLGHSFGAATTVEILRSADRFSWISQGIIYDMWGAPVGPPQEDHKLRRPLLGINSEAFMYWEANFRSIVDIMDEARNHGAPAWLLTVRGTIHITQSDFPILYRYICSFFFQMTANPKRAMDVNVNASLEYLRLVLPAARPTIDRTMTSEHFLDSPVLDVKPQDHKPPDKHIAARLEVPHQVRNRVLPTVTRKMKRTARRSQANRDEIWMHVKASEEEVNYYLKNVFGTNMAPI